MGRGLKSAIQINVPFRNSDTQKEIVIMKENPNYVKRTQRDYSLSFKLNVIKEIESGNLSTIGACCKYSIQAQNTAVNWLRKSGSFDWEYQTLSNMPKSSEQKIMELEAQVKLLQKQKALLERQAYVADKKTIIFDMMMNFCRRGISN